MRIPRDASFALLFAVMLSCAGCAESMVAAPDASAGDATNIVRPPDSAVDALPTLDASIGDASAAPNADAAVVQQDVAREAAVPPDVALRSDVATPDGGELDICDSTSGFENPPCVGTTRVVGGRDVCVFVPSSYRAGTPMPVVMVLHGFGASGQGQARYFNLDAIAESRGFILVKPDGTPIVGNVGRSWNATDQCCSGETDRDDVAHLTAVIADVARSYSIISSRVYLMGHSNGAFMSYRLICDHADQYAGVVGFAGSVDTTPCSPSRAVPILHIHGTTDAVIRYTGGTVIAAREPYGSVEQTLAFWAGVNTCTGTRARTSSVDFMCDERGLESDVETYPSCATPLEHWKLPGGHIPRLSQPRVGAAMVDWLFSHSVGT